MQSTMPGRRVTRVAKVLVDVAWWGVLALIAVILALLAWLALFERGTAPLTGVHVTIPDEAARELLPLASADTVVAGSPVLTSVEGMLEIRTSWWVIALASTVGVPTLVAVLIGLRLIRAFLNDVLAEQVFTDANARRLAHLGWLVVGAGAALPVLEYWYSRIVLWQAGLSGITLGTRFDFPEIVLAGVLLLVVAAAWRYGVQLQRDHDLTV